MGNGVLKLMYVACLSVLQTYMPPPQSDITLFYSHVWGLIYVIGLLFGLYCYISVKASHYTSLARCSIYVVAILKGIGEFTW